MNGAQVSAFQANSGIAPSAMATVLVGVVFAGPARVGGVMGHPNGLRRGGREPPQPTASSSGVCIPLRRDVPRPELLLLS